MGLLDFLRRPDINEGVARWADTPGALLLDVRAPAEIREGHIPGTRSLPLDQLRRAAEVAADPETPLFLYCYSGARSAQAAGALRRMGYTNITNIGGIAAWKGSVER